MNLFRHALSMVKEGAFFSKVSFTGAHRESIRRLKNHEGDLASIDSVTYDYLDRYQSEEIKGLKIIARSAVSPCLPYITSILRSEDEASKIRSALNEALRQLPEVAEDLAIKEVLPASDEDYEVLRKYERFATGRGFSFVSE
ncbi:ABC-type phosphate/phosphonate transport system substrate-binding protein [Pseudomonas lini]|nr:ABC-type phosphate/phosphonate transport system substrate-binding protein [Pseudomonas lini]